MREIFLQGNILRTTTNALRSYRGFVHLLTFKMAFILTLSDVREDFKKNLVTGTFFHTVYISIPYTQVAPNILIQHWSK